ncbi:MAG: hypothetical protein HYS16_00145 [Deltaproteobacteria bacterium]|nr:MAG: hypothetical protein HYS16_00145 [Deltaproteobacteria bacterium]
MNIVDYKFRSIIITEKGKIIPFDSIECLLGWGRIYRKKCQVFFSDFRAPDTLIVGKKAFILKSDKRPSPMGGGLSAYSTLESVLQAQRQVGGVRIEIK